MEQEYERRDHDSEKNRRQSRLLLENNADRGGNKRRADQINPKNVSRNPCGNAGCDDLGDGEVLRGKNSQGNREEHTSERKEFVHSVQLRHIFLNDDGQTERQKDGTCEVCPENDPRHPRGYERGGNERISDLQ